MAEEAPAVQNKMVLIVAIILALVVVVIYNVHMAAVKSALQSKKVTLLRAKVDFKPGDMIKDGDLDLVEVDAEQARALGNVCFENDRNIVRTSMVNTMVGKGQYLLWDYFLGGGRKSSPIPTGMVAKVLAVDSKTSLGNLLHPGNYVNILGLLPGEGNRLQSTRIIENLRVVAVGGKEEELAGSPRTQTQMYRNIAVQVSPEVSLQLDNVLTHVRGAVTLELVANPKVSEESPKVSAAVMKYAASADAPSAPGEGG